jgi:thioredoxin reductase (NADPH)
MAGLTAAIYALRFKLSATVIASEPGGVITESALVENWPGEKSISGMDLMDKVRAQAEALGCVFILEEVKSISGKAGAFALATAAGQAVRSRTVLLALGCQRRKLGVPGEKEFTGRGVSYCATCDAFFFKGKSVAVIGGSDSAVGSAELLANFADKVHIIYRRGKLRSEPLRTDRVLANPRIAVIYNSTVESVHGAETVTGVALNGGRKLAVDGVFVEVGFDPPRALPSELGVAVDEAGFIRIDAAGHTDVPGVYAAGDVTTGSNYMRQLVTAAAEGAIAAESIYNDTRPS